MIRWAQGRGLKVLGETCPQYLFLTESDLDKHGLEGAKCVCAPPPGSAENQAALWRSLESGVFQVYSSDHAAFRFDDPNGKLRDGPKTPFHRITNGVPGGWVEVLDTSDQRRRRLRGYSVRLAPHSVALLAFEAEH